MSGWVPGTRPAPWCSPEPVGDLYAFRRIQVGASALRWAPVRTRPLPKTSRRSAHRVPVAGVALSLSLVLTLGLAVVSACTTGRSHPSGAHVSTSSQAASGRPFPAITGQGLAEAKAAALQKELERWVTTGLLPGVTAGVVSRGRVWSGAAGVDRTGTKLTPQSGLTIGSVTKTFVAAEVLRLVDEGGVKLDSPASAYLQSPLLANGVTVRQLLGMRSGIPQAVEPRALVTGTTRVWTVSQALATVPRHLATPGATYEYNNVNYWLLGLLVERKRGMPLGPALSRGVFHLAGLTRITLQSDRPLAPPLTRPADDEVDIPIPARPDGYMPFRSLATYVGAAGSIASDAPTVARWGYQLYGGHILSPSTLQGMLDVSDGDHYGLGLMDFTDLRWNIKAVGHVGEQVGYRAVLVSFEQPQLSVALLTPSTTETGPLVQYLVKAGTLLK